MNNLDFPINYANLLPAYYGNSFVYFIPHAIIIESFCFLKLQSGVIL
jgi:hypothetical protein